MLRLASQTHVGLVRSKNEDSVAIHDGGTWLMVVADGMGGHNAGEVASRIAAEGVLKAARSGAHSIKELTEAINEANSEIYERSKSVFGCSGMGTTLVLASGSQGEAVVANVGDSRAYSYTRKGNKLRQITRDHSLVEELVAAKRLTKEQALTYQYRNVITRAVGTSSAVKPDIFEVELEDGDALLLCSDGLTNEVPDIRIRDVLKKMKDPEMACDELIGLALSGGGRDNITVAIAFCDGGGKGGDGR